jgi:hypothetical protein
LLLSKSCGTEAHQTNELEDRQMIGGKHFSLGASTTLQNSMLWSTATQGGVAEDAGTTGSSTFLKQVGGAFHAQPTPPGRTVPNTGALGWISTPASLVRMPLQLMTVVTITQIHGSVLRNQPASPCSIVAKDERFWSQPRESPCSNPQE